MWVDEKPHIQSGLLFIPLVHEVVKWNQVFYQSVWKTVVWEIPSMGSTFLHLLMHFFLRLRIIKICWYFIVFNQNLLPAVCGCPLRHCHLRKFNTWSQIWTSVAPLGQTTNYSTFWHCKGEWGKVVPSLCDWQQSPWPSLCEISHDWNDSEYRCAWWCCDCYWKWKLFRSV